MGVILGERASLGIQPLPKSHFTGDACVTLPYHITKTDIL